MRFAVERISGPTCQVNNSNSLLRRKLAHVQLNRSDLKYAMAKRLERRDRKFLDDDIVDGIGPWATVSDDT